jgi:hypothetical protein
MSFQARALVPIIVSAAAMAASAPAARADEAYVCGPDKLVYVKASELEAKKHSDPCIAAYYGITLGKESERETAKPASEAAEPAPAIPQDPIEFKSLTDAEPPQRRANPGAHAALVRPPTTAPGTDYRNVRIINASSDARQWFRHAR